MRSVAQSDVDIAIANLNFLQIEPAKVNVFHREHVSRCCGQRYQTPAFCADECPFNCGTACVADMCLRCEVVAEAARQIYVAWDLEHDLGEDDIFNHEFVVRLNDQAKNRADEK